MKTIGMLGGMSWESTATYYKALNEKVRDKLGGLNSAQIAMYSVNFDEIESLQHQGKWQEAADILSETAQAIEKAGADFLLICTNTMHKIAPEIAASISIPVLHIADSTGEALLEDGVARVGLLGTQFTMSQSFYKDRIANGYDIEVVVPTVKQQQIIHDIIYQELCQGVVKESSRTRFLNIIDEMANLGCHAVILGCTEISMLVNQQHTKMPLYDTTILHADKAVDMALS